MHEALTFGIIISRVIVSWAVECNPTLYLLAGDKTKEDLLVKYDSSVKLEDMFVISNLKLPPKRQVDFFCEDGNWGFDKGTWLVDKCYKGTNNCQCMCHCNDNGNCAQPSCVSSFDTSVQLCFSTKTACPLAPIGYYTAGCGCVKTIYDGNVYVCDKGHILPCPPEHLCVGNYRLPTKCDPGFYPVHTNATAQCQPCRCPAGNYVPGISAENICTGSFTQGQCVPCDACTEGINADVRNIFNCPLRDPEKGVYSDGSCKKCRTCVHPEYAFGNQTENFCITDKTITRCEQQYWNSLNQRDYDQTQNMGQNLVVKGPMPWKSGHKRMEPKYLMVTGSQQTGRQGNLPSYVPCPAAPLGYVYVPDSNENVKTKLSGLNSWFYDCEMPFAMQCATGFYAVLSSSSISSVKAGLSGLLSCERCPPFSLTTNTGGFSTSCPCIAGHASKQHLLAKFGGDQGVFVNQRIAEEDSDAQCVSCYNGVFWRHHDNSFYREALLCHYTGAQVEIDWCTNRTYLASTDATVCSTCPTTEGGYPTIPSLDRTSCVLCPVGKFIRVEVLNGTRVQDKWSCVSCDSAKDEYQDLPGQFACKKKRTRCEPGRMLQKNDKTFTADHSCVGCDVGCPLGQITIRSANTNASDTCDGNGRSFFGCYDGTSDDSSPSFRLGTRLVYSYTGSSLRATVDECDSTLLPPHSEWVSNEVPSLGVQCYFACKHGVSTSTAEAYQSKIQSYIRLSRRDLVPFLRYTVQFSTAAPLTSVLVEDSTYPNSPSMSWVKKDFYRVDARVKSQVSLNTFLFVDEILGSNFTNSGDNDMCLSPREAYPSSLCLDGFIQAGSDTRVLNADSQLPMGISQPLQSLNDLKCAFFARSQLYHIAMDSSARYSVVSAHGRELCAIDDFGTTGLSTFRAGCTINCLDLLHEQLNVKLSPCHIVNLDYARLWYLKYYLSTTYWQEAPSNVPYVFTSKSNCSFRCNSDSVRISLRDFDVLNPMCYSSDNEDTNLAACVPCNNISIQPLCDRHRTPHFFIEGSCSNPRTLLELTFRDVCASCDVKANAVLIPSSSNAYSDWWYQRRSSNTFQARDRSGNFVWESIHCRYTCNEGYTSNNVDAASYRVNPCVPCGDGESNTECMAYRRSNTPIYLSTTQTCGASNNYAPFLPSCEACASSTNRDIFIFFNSSVTPRSLTKCLALCRPDRFHTVRVSLNGNSSAFISHYTDEPVPLEDIRCTECSVDLTRPCNQSCSRGYYKSSASTCVQCNVSSCSSTSFQYREECLPGSTRDAACVSCPTTPLYNDVDEALSRIIVAGNDRILLRNSLLNTKGLLVRKRLGSSQDIASARVFSVYQNECPVECINNYVWINVTTGLHPFSNGQRSLQLTSDLVCIPCSSEYITSGLETVNTASSQNSNNNDNNDNSNNRVVVVLYSVWNATNSTSLLPPSRPGSVLYHMTSTLTRGACYSCPDLTRDVLDTSTSMCELRRGASSTQSMQAGLGTVVTNIGMARPIATSSRSSFSFCFGDECMRRRRLLSTAVSDSATSLPLSPNANEKIKKVVFVKKHPVIDTRDHFLCCETLSRGNLALFQNCKRERLALLESKKTLTGTSWGRDFCNAFVVPSSSPPTRRLLSLEENTTTTMTTTEMSADNNYTDVSVSSILNGTDGGGVFYYVDDPNWCHTGTYKESRGDGPCLVCPAGTSTMFPYSGVADKHACKCLPGFFAVRNRTDGTLVYCSACGLDHYRSPTSQNDSFCLPCPVNTYTPTTSSAYCYCKPGYFRSSFEGPCEPCENPSHDAGPVNFYCVNDNKYSCPLHSAAPPRSSSRGDCVCNATTHYGSLESPDSQCMHKPPGIQCTIQPGMGVVGCSCAEGWLRDTTSGNCVTPCGQGQYASILESNQKFLQCIDCPLHTYSDNPQLIAESGKSSDLVCRQCPPNTFTAQVGSYSLEQCTCPSRKFNSNSSTSDQRSGLRCDTCPPNTYLNVSVFSSNTCQPCPGDTTSEAGSIGIESCVCAPGRRAVRSYSVLNWYSTTTTPTITCEPCPLGFFSMKMGSVCTPCPQGYVTAKTGSTSLRDCSLRIYDDAARSF